MPFCERRSDPSRASIWCAQFISRLDERASLLTSDMRLLRPYARHSRLSARRSCGASVAPDIAAARHQCSSTRRRACAWKRRLRQASPTHTTWPARAKRAWGWWHPAEHRHEGNVRACLASAGYRSFRVGDARPTCRPSVLSSTTLPRDCAPSSQYA